MIVWPITQPSVSAQVIGIPRNAREAIEALGPKAVPMIGSWLNSGSAEIPRKLRKLAISNRHFGWLAKWRWVKTDPRDIAYRALTAIPEHCAPLVPILRRQVLAGGSEAIPAERALTQIAAAVPEDQSRKLAEQNRDLLRIIPAHAPIGERAIAATQILAILNHRRAPGEREMLFRRIWPWREANPRIRHSLFLLDEDGFFHNMHYLESGSAAQQASAAFCFRDLPRSPERIVPLLSSNLRSGNITVLWNTCEALGSYQNAAISALPFLTALMKDRNDARIVPAVSNAIERITRHASGATAAHQ